VAAKRRHDRGEERRWLEFSAGVMKGRRDHGIEGKKGRRGSRVLITFVRGRGSTGEGWLGW
jgi:hypothetical protein